MALNSWKLPAAIGIGVGIAMGAMIGLSPTHAKSETLTDVLIKAYRTSPVLRLNQAALRATDEGVAQARAGLRPQIALDGQVGVSSRAGESGFTRASSLALTASLLIADGGATKAAIESAKQTVFGTRAQLRDIEQSIFLNAVTAYVDVRRDQRNVRLAQNNITVIDQQVQAARDRFEVGEVTRTDVSQAQARRASAVSALAANRGALERSRQAFTAAVGFEPVNLATPPSLPTLPSSLQAAHEIASQRHPALAAARHFETASLFDLKRAKAGRSPVFDVQASARLNDNSSTRSGFSDNDTLSLTLNGRLPIYQGGQISSLQRQAQAVLAQRQANIQQTAREISQSVGVAWANLQVARASIRASQQQIRAAQIAFDGVTEEAKLGARTTLDVLNAEQELLNARSSLTAAERDEYVGAYTLMSAVGLLSVKHLGLGIEEYNPESNYLIVKDAPFRSKQGAAIDRISKRWNN